MGSTTACSGQKLMVENDDNGHPEELYVEKDCAEMYSGATELQIDMAVSAAAKVIGNTQKASGTDLAASFTARGITLDVAAGTFTINRSGLYRLYWCGRIQGEEDEPVTFEWQKNGTNLGQPTEAVVAFNATGGVSSLTDQRISHECKQDFLKGDVVACNVLGSNSEAIVFDEFVIGVEQCGSRVYGPA